MVNLKKSSANRFTKHVRIQIDCICGQCCYDKPPPELQTIAGDGLEDWEQCLQFE